MKNEVKVTYFSDILGRFDKQAGVIRGVSVITEGKAKGHDLIVDSQTLMEVKEAAESRPDGRLKTKLNHRSGVEAVFGYLENFRVEGPKLLADLRMLKSHKDFDQTFEQIEALPNQIGLSVAFVGKECCAPSGEKLARCREILSADLVPEPAANPTGMFEAKTDAVVDTEKISNMNEPTKPNPTPSPTPSPAPAEPTIKDLMDFMQTQILPRIEATEQFQSAIQAELEAAAENPDGEDTGGLKPGDDGNKHHITPNPGEQRDGGTRAGAASSPSNQPDTGKLTPQPVGAELQALRDTVVELQRKWDDKENEEREVQFETAMKTIKAKTEAVVEYARGLEQENHVLLEALKTGVKPAKQSPSEIFLSTENPEDFQSIVKKHVDAGKSKTEAVMLARKENPQAHLTWLSNQGVVTTL